MTTPTPELSPTAQLSLLALISLTVNELYVNLTEQHGFDAENLTRETYDQAMNELEAAGLIKQFQPEEEGEEDYALPGPEAFQKVFALFVEDVRRHAQEPEQA